MILVSQQVTERTRFGERSARALGAVLGPLGWSHCLVLAAVSGIAEEAFFRGAVQPRFGLVAASLSPEYSESLARSWSASEANSVAW